MISINTLQLTTERGMWKAVLKGHYFLKAPSSPSLGDPERHFASLPLPWQEDGYLFILLQTEGLLPGLQADLAMHPLNHERAQK